MKSNISKKMNFIEDNQGASLLLVLAVFVVLLVVAMNLLMLVSAGDRTTNQEYDATQTELYLASVYDVLNEKMEEGIWKEAFVRDETTSIEVTGFVDGAGNAMPVSIDITLTGNLADVEYKITYQGKQYGIKAKYSCRKKEDSFTVTLKVCEAIEQL